MKYALKLLVALGSSALFLWLAFRHVDLEAAAALVSRVDLAFVALYTATLLVGQLVRALRWAVLVRPLAAVPMGPLLRISNVGLMLMVVLPLRLGELARPYLTKKETGASLSAGLGAVAVERAADGLLVSLLFFVSTMWLGADTRVPRALWVAAIFALVLFASVTVFLVVTLLARERGLRLFDTLARPLPSKVAETGRRVLTSFVDGLQTLPNARAVLTVVAWTLVYWVLSGLGLFWAMRAFGWDLPLVAGFLVVSVLVIGIMIPAGPGFLGPYQGAILAGLSIFGVSATEATAYGLVVYPLNLAVVLACGLPYLVFGKTRMREMVAVESPGPA